MLSASDTGTTPSDTGVSVEIVGEGIVNEGTYHLPSDSEIIHLVEAAGGVKPGAITSGINWHRKLYEGLRLTVPTKQVFEDARAGTSTLTNRDLIRFRAYTNRDTETQSEGAELLNLNAASRNQLQELPGIGDVLAGRIIDYREENGGFDRVEEIREVFGIGDVTYQELRAKVSVH